MDVIQMLTYNCPLISDSRKLCTKVADIPCTLGESTGNKVMLCWFRILSNLMFFNITVTRPVTYIIMRHKKWYGHLFVFSNDLPYGTQIRQNWIMVNLPWLIGIYIISLRRYCQIGWYRDGKDVSGNSSMLSMHGVFCESPKSKIHLCYSVT